MTQQRPVRSHVNVEARAGPAADHLAVVRNVSLSGCLLSTRAKLKQSQYLLLVIPLGGGAELRLTGTVVRWHEGGEEGGGYGVSFDQVAGEDMLALALLVAGGVERRDDQPGAGVEAAGTGRAGRTAS